MKKYTTDQIIEILESMLGKDLSAEYYKTSIKKTIEMLKKLDK